MTTTSSSPATDDAAKAVLGSPPPPPVRPTKPKKPTARRLTPGEQGFRVVNGIVLSGFALICVLPFVNVLASSLATPGEIATTPFILFPKTFTLDAYRYILSTPTIFRAMGVSMFVTVVGPFSASCSRR